MSKITIDGKEYDISNPSGEVQSQLDNLQFVEEGSINQRNNELQIALTAKIGYSRALNRELEKIGNSDE